MRKKGKQWKSDGRFYALNGKKHMEMKSAKWYLLITVEPLKR